MRNQHVGMMALMTAGVYYSTSVTLLMALPFTVLLVLDTPEVPGSLTGSSLGFLAAEPLSSSCLTSVE